MARKTVSESSDPATNVSSVETEAYIPPPGIYFRMLSPFTSRVIHSKNEDNSPLGSWKPAPDHTWGPGSAGWFSLIPGTGDFEGKYLIRSRKTGKYIYSKAPPIPDKQRVGHCDEVAWQTDYTHFKLVPGKGQWAGHFRLVVETQGQEWALYLGTSQDSAELSNHPAQEVFDNQYFCFIYEDLDIREVRYDLENAKVLPASPLTLDTQKLVNHTTVSQVAQFSLNGSQNHVGSFEYTSGMEIKSGSSFSARTPFVGPEGSISLDLDATTRSWGSEDVFKKNYGTQLTVNAPPGKTVVASLTVTKGALEVPFTVILTSKTGGETQSKGIWRGELSWGEHYTITELK